MCCFFWSSLDQKLREGNLKLDKQEANKSLRLAPPESSEGQSWNQYPGHLPPQQPHPCGWPWEEGTHGYKLSL